MTVEYTEKQQLRDMANTQKGVRVRYQKLIINNKTYEGEKFYRDDQQNDTGEQRKKTFFKLKTNRQTKNRKRMVKGTS